MSETSDRIETGCLIDVVRLKVNGVSTTVNTLRDQQTARGLSLVCPFPALEVDIPVEFGRGPGGVSTSGTIHRIGVEDDPETGLPRLRLSVRSHQSRATVVAPPTPSLLEEASRMTALAPADERDQGDEETQRNTTEDHLPDDLWAGIDDLEDDEDDDDLFADGDTNELGPVYDNPDPAWAECSELPLPESMTNSSKTRRRRRAAAVMAWTMVLALGAGGVFVLGEAGVLDLGSARHTLGAFLFGADAVQDGADGPTIEELLGTPNQTKIASLAEEVNGGGEELATAVPPAFPQAESALEAAQTSVVAAFDQQIDVADHSVETEVEDFSALIQETEGAVAPVSMVDDAGQESGEAVAAGPQPEVETGTPGDEDITIILPTRWPVEYATAYRLRNPNGVVVDVPGGLVKKEGWLEEGTEHEMIRSIKAVQRETGARFVIFINGALPRFLTSSKTGGVALKLMREAAEVPGETEQVAMLAK